MNDYYLIHYGVKGMKWGVIRKRVSDSVRNSYHYQKHQLKKRAKIEKARRKYSTKTIRGLSDSELRDRINRLELERKYKSLSKNDLRPGHAAVNQILSESGKKVLTAAAAGLMAYTIKAKMTKNFDWKEAANYIAPNPNQKKK